MPLPAQRTVHGTVTDLFTGAGPTTTITITALPRRWTDAGGDQLLVSPDHTVPVTGGAWSIALVPTDAAGIEPVTGRYYRLQEVVSGVPGRARTFEAPTGDMTPISILALIVDDPGYRDTCAGRRRGGDRRSRWPHGGYGSCGCRWARGCDRPDGTGRRHRGHWGDGSSAAARRCWRGSDGSPAVR